MDFWLYRIGGGIILFVLEMFVGSLDFLALGIAAFVTAGLTYFLGLGIDQLQLSGIIFLIASVISLMLTRLLVTPNIMGDIVDSPMSGDSIVGKEFIVKEINGRDVIKYEGMYWNITSDTEYGSGDTIRVRSLDDNLVVVEKISG